jgi:hypothetical protein
MPDEVLSLSTGGISDIIWLEIVLPPLCRCLWGPPLKEVDQALDLYFDAQRIVFHYLSYQYGMLASFRNGNSSGCAYENVKKATVIL